MTRNSDFKQVVRARMAETGETYTVARAAVGQQAPPPMVREPTAPERTVPEPTVPEPTVPEPTVPEPTVGDPAAYDVARSEQERLVARLFTNGRLAQVPAKRKTRVGALLEVLSRFEPGRVYSEPEVNEVLLDVHEDFAYLRRELVNYHYLERGDGRYRIVAAAPVRARIEEQEIPAWEAVWLPGFVAGA